MKNPFHIFDKNHQEMNIGDPFIMRFDGKYYLYFSSQFNEVGVRVFSSEDCMHFEDCGYALKDEIITNAYAPEVVYNDGIFYLCTSPHGNGHYLFKSTSPSGPFVRISENIHNMIDGSFFKNEEFKIKFLRADHNGIAELDLEDENKLVNRKNILPQISGAWSEGPSLFYKDGYYFITYCGNFVLSSSYRIKIASSKQYDQNFVVQDEPLVISTSPNHYALGHNSIVLGPSLDEYLIVYHNLDEYEKGKFFRRLNIDKLSFSGRHVSCNPTDFEIENLLSPTEVLDINKDFMDFEFGLISKKEMENDFVLEINCAGNKKTYFSYIDKDEYYAVETDEHEVKIIHHTSAEERVLIQKQVNISFKNLHCFRFINKENLEILIDDVPLFKLKKVHGGKLGFDNKEGTSYLAFTNIKKVGEVPLPGIIEESEFLGTCKKENDYSDDEYLVLNKDEEIKVNVRSSIKNKYHLFINHKSKDKAVIQIESLNNKKIIQLGMISDEYEFLYEDIDTLVIDKKDEIKIKVLEGKLSFKRIKLVEDELKLPKVIDNSYHFVLPKFKSGIQGIEFVINKFSRNSLFGIVLNGSNYSEHDSNKEPKFMGYLIGFRNDLLVVEHCQYDTSRIYDVPLPIKCGQKYKLKIIYNQSNLKVFVDGNEKINTNLPFEDVKGYIGYFKNLEANVNIKNYEEKKNEKD